MITLGLAAWGFRETSLEDQLIFTKEMGLSLLELSIANGDSDFLGKDADQAEINEVRKLYSKYGISLDCTSTGCDFTQSSPEACYTDLEKLKHVIGIAGRLEAKTLRIFSGFSPVGEVTGIRWNIMLECLQKAAIKAEEVGVTLVIETHGGVNAIDNGVEHFTSTSTEPDSLERMLNELPSSIALLYDPANLSALGAKQPHEVYSRFKERVKCIHLKDFAKVGSTDALAPVACGEGMLNWNILMDSIKDYSGPALIEYENPEDVKDGCRRSLEFLQNI